MEKEDAGRRFVLVVEHADGHRRRVTITASSLEDLESRLCTEESDASVHSRRIERFDPASSSFMPLTDLSSLSSPARVRIIDHATTSGTGSGERERLALPWRRFPVELSGEGLLVNGRRLVVRGVENSGEGTGHTTWDGAVVLAKYLEHRYSGDDLRGKRVLETGAAILRPVMLREAHDMNAQKRLVLGTGLVGLSAAALGASSVILTDLNYTLHNLQANVDANFPSSEAIRVREVDWMQPPADLGPLDLILAADVVWLNELVQPLVGALGALTEPPSTHAEILMSYQSRSTITDQLLHSALRRKGFRVDTVPPLQQHPVYRAPGVIHIYRITRATARADITLTPTTVCPKGHVDQASDGEVGLEGRVCRDVKSNGKDGASSSGEEVGERP